MWTPLWPSLLVAVAVTWAGAQGLLCACNTAACRDQGQTTCNATAMCYVQYLDLGDGSDPLVRGCIASKTPLLCENRRPALAGSWPVLVCCAHAPMCNKDSIPGNLPTTTPLKTSSPPVAEQSSSALPPVEPDPKAIVAVFSSKNIDSGRKTQQTVQPESPAPSHNQSERETTSSGGGLGAAYAALLAVACSLLVLVAGALALFLLRRRALSMTSGHYGAMHGGYFKGHTTRNCADLETAHGSLCGKRPPPATAS